MVPDFVSSLWWKRYLRRNACSASDLERFPSLSPNEQRRDLARRLLEQIHYFGSREDALPEWRDAARINDPDELWNIWPSLPIMTKAMLQQHFPAAEIGRRFGLTGIVNSTGGSTGEPTHFFQDTGMVLSVTAAINHSRRLLGWRPGMPLIIVWGSERDIGKETGWKHRLHGRLRNEYLLDAYKLSDETVDRVVSLARQLRPVAIYGFTSMLEYVAERVLERGIPLPRGAVATAWNGGEMLFPNQAELFERAFGTRLRNCYGGRELSVMAVENGEAGPLIVMRPWLYLEVVNDAGKPAAPGEPGRLIWTSTICRGTPFLRYDIEDVGMYCAGDADESGVHTITELQGRVAGLLELPDGRKINNIFWNHLFKEMPEVRQFQIILRKQGTLRILLRGSGFTPDRERRLRTVLGDFLGSIPVDIEWVDRIPLSAQGKLVQVVREK